MIWIAHTAVDASTSVSDAGVLDEVDGVVQSLSELGYPHATITPEPSLLTFIQRITQNGRNDVVFNLVESYRGSPWGESWIASFYEAFQVTYSGSPPSTLSLCLDKRRTRAVLAAAGFPIAPGISIKESRPCLDGLEFPIIVKPACRDASEGMNASCVVHDEDALHRKIENMIQEGYWPVLLEQFIAGREFSIALLQRDGVWEVISIFEVDFSGLPAHLPHILCFDAKWHEETAAYAGTVTEPMQGDSGLYSRLCDIAIRTVQELNIRDYARIDMRYSQAGQPYIIDVNPNPDISLSGGFFRAITAGNITYTQFVQQVVESTLKRRYEA
jgi:D-alanine-D-alanine ligase